jgi:multidrug resistance efflux pump
MTSQQEPENNLSLLLQLEAMARKAESDKSLQFLMVNETRRLVNYRQAFVLSLNNIENRSYRVEAASSLAIIDKNAPYIKWLERIVGELFDDSQVRSQQRIDAETCPEQYRKEWLEYSLPFVAWSPLLLPDGTLIGGLWFTRETPWQDNELTLINRLSETYAHAWAALVGTKRLTRGHGLKQRIALITLTCLVLVSFIPVRLSAIAPAEIVAKEPAIVSAPMDGVIKALPVSPNTQVAIGDVVFRYEDTNLRNSHEIAKRSYEVAAAKLRKASQGAFQDIKYKAQVSLLEAETRLKKTELDYAQELLQQVDVTASRDGLLIYTDKSDWIGRPVAVGERIMEIANPEEVQVRIDLPVDDAIVLNEGAEVQVFLNVDPLTSVSASIARASFNAYLTPSDVLAYRVEAAITDPDADVRIGLQGSAKVYGPRVSLFFYVFRRPISALRQFIGI